MLIAADQRATRGEERREEMGHGFISEPCVGQSGFMARCVTRLIPRPRLSGYLLESQIRCLRLPNTFFFFLIFTKEAYVAELSVLGPSCNHARDELTVINHTNRTHRSTPLWNSSSYRPPANDIPYAPENSRYKNFLPAPRFSDDTCYQVPLAERERDNSTFDFTAVKVQPRLTQPGQCYSNKMIIQMSIIHAPVIGASDIHTPTSLILG